MLSIVLSLAGGIAAALGLNYGWPGHPVWCTLLFLVVGLGILTCINLLLKKKLEAVFNDVQEHILKTQAILRRKIASVGPHAGPKFQQQLEEEQTAAVREAIGMLDRLKPFQKWNFMVGKQADTLRAQFYFQIKDFENADKYLAKALLLDPMLVAMQMAHYYKLGGKDAEITKCFNKGAARFKDDKAVIVYATYSWILVQQNKIDEAIQVLVQAKTRAEHEVLKQNWDHLVNGQLKRFSNAGLGDTWYALYLEQPKMVQMQERPPRGGRGGFGRF